jgi:proline iminopeptidase
MPPIPPPRATGATTTTDVPLHWCRYGVPGGEPLLVLHGGPGASHDYLLPQLLALGAQRDLLFYDQRGGGRSKTDDPAPVTWQRQVADLAAVIGELMPPGPPTLVGYSWGALLAMLYATEAVAGRAGPSPARLVLISPAAVTSDFRAQFDAEFARRNAGPAIAALREELAASGLRERDVAAWRQRTFELAVAPYFADPARAHDLTPFRVTAKVQQAVWDSLGTYDLQPALRGLDIPTLVVHGREDPIPLASAAAVAEALRGRLVVLEDCGHVPYVEAPDALFAAIEDFLSTTPTRP